MMFRDIAGSDRQITNWQHGRKPEGGRRSLLSDSTKTYVFILPDPDI